MSSFNTSLPPELVLPAIRWDPNGSNLRLCKTKFEEIFVQKQQKNPLLLDFPGASQQITSTYEAILSFLQEKQVLPTTNTLQPWHQDIIMGLTLYTFFKPDQYGMRTLTRTDFWAYVTCHLIPNQTWKRWEKSANMPDRFYKHSRRVWGKATWWLIHLSWQEQMDDNGTVDWESSLCQTTQLLATLSTDYSLNLIERSGNQGYDVEMYRSVLRCFRAKYTKYDTKRFRELMKLINAFQYQKFPVVSNHSIVEKQKKMDAFVNNFLTIIKTLFPSEP